MGNGSDFTGSDLADVIIVSDAMYVHKTARIYYTTYDMRRMCDSLNPRRQADFIVASKDPLHADHPYQYGRVLGIFHVMVSHRGRNATTATPQLMHFLLVRWFTLDYNDDGSSTGGWKSKRLHRLSFAPANNPSHPAFSILDPAAIIRAIHIVPAFRYGRTESLLPSSPIARVSNNLKYHNSDWDTFYVERFKLYFWSHVAILTKYSFADRDLFMRFRGGAVGHSEQMRTLLLPFESDRDPLDAQYRQRQCEIDAKGLECVFDEEAVKEAPDGSEDEGSNLDDLVDQMFKPLNDDKSGWDDEEGSGDDESLEESEADEGDERMDRSDSEGSDYMDEDDEESDGVSIGGDWDGEGGFLEALGYALL